MKKFFKFLGIVILLAVAFILISGLFIPREFHFERSVMIKAPKEVIWNNLSHFSSFEQWDPWKVKDPAMKRTIEGADGTVGAAYSWEGNSDVGSGTMTYKGIYPYDSILVDLHFKKPFESRARAFYRMSAEVQGYKVTWGFDTRMPYPVNAVSYFCFDMEGSLDKDFSSGLASLKKLCESNAAMMAMR